MSPELPRPPALSPDRFGKLRYLFLSLAVIVLDQWSKWMIEVHLPYHTSHPLFPGLNLAHVRNTGVAFGLFASEGGRGSWLLVGLGLLALTAVAVYFRFTPSHDRFLLAALALVVGGAVGNLIDRATSGAVTDFVDVYAGSHHWPAFNVADSAISVGIVLMLLDSFRSRRAPAPAEAGEG